MFTPKKSFDTPEQEISKTCSPVIEETGRFIPNRVSSNLNEIFEKAVTSSLYSTTLTEKSRFSSILHHELFGFSIESTFLKYHTLHHKENKENLPSAPFSPSQPENESQTRSIPKSPYIILDAPRLKDDFYVDLVKWSSQNLITVALGGKIYTWNAYSSEEDMIEEFEGETITSISWNTEGRFLASGEQEGFLNIFDISTGKEFYSKLFPYGRIGSLAWNGPIVSAGSKEGVVIHTDLRAPEIIVKQKVHEQEVCGLKWSPEGRYCASGGNDNKIVIWGAQQAIPAGILTGHTAAVRALAWHSEGILASGGGTADKMVKIWNMYSFQEQASVNTHSEVCNMVFSKNTEELVTSHGFARNLVIVWRNSDLEKVGVLSGHSKRVLFMDISPDGESVVTGSGDENLMFWNVFPKSKTDEQIIPFNLSAEDIR